MPLEYQGSMTVPSAPPHRSRRKGKGGDSAGFVVLSLLLIGLGAAAELGGAPGASWFFWGIWFVLLIVRLAISAVS
jgi:hypothetical protein